MSEKATKEVRETESAPGYFKVDPKFNSRPIAGVYSLLTHSDEEQKTGLWRSS
jgi:hypothetical protein